MQLRCAKPQYDFNFNYFAGGCCLSLGGEDFKDMPAGLLTMIEQAAAKIQEGTTGREAGDFLDV